MSKTFLIFAVSFYFFVPSEIFADITVPYTTDEKSQVLFGDSQELDTHYGLENYIYNYVGGYLHITFTYTHAGIDTFCCFAAYPPRLYITDTDPRSTSTQSVRSSETIYPLAPRPVPPGHETDWYSYDIQFDTTGYTVTVLQGGATSTASFHRDIAGLMNSDWAALANLYPLQNPVNEYSMSFTPLETVEVVEEEEIVATTTPVIIVPGIMGTKLVDSSNSEVWPNLSSMLLSVDDSYLDPLSLSNTGEQSGETITADSIVRDTGGNDFFNGLFSSFSSNDFIEDEDIFEYPYDWRMDIESSALKLKEKIEAIKAQRGVEKVNLVAHSMGGLVTKKYIKDFGGDSIDTFIDVGTPHTGAPKTFKILNYGDNLDASILFKLFGLNSNKIKEISQNMPAVYQLLPSQKYFDNADPNYYVWNGVNGSNRMTFAQTGDYLKAEGRNNALVDRAKAFHEEIDNLNPSDYGVETYNIVGCGTPTIGQFYILEGGEHPIYNIKMINGDGTVPLKSAEALTASTTYYVKNAQHALMPSTSGVKELITHLVSTSTNLFDLSPYSNLSNSSNGCTIPDGRLVSFHSPIELHIYDTSGNHTGPDDNGDIENEVAGVIYEVIGDNKFAFLPNGVEYTVKGEATSEGSFDVRIQEVVGGEVATTTVFADIPLTLTTQTEFTIGASIPTQITLDTNNDGVFEQDYPVSTTTSGILESTGKVAVIVAASPQVTDITSSRPVSPETDIATSSEPIIPVPVATTTPNIIPVTQAPAAKPVEKIIATTSPEQIPENPALVYKSLTYKVKSIFSNLWSWIKSKL